MYTRMNSIRAASGTPILISACLTILLLLAACGGEQAAPPTPTSVPREIAEEVTPAPLPATATPAATIEPTPTPTATLLPTADATAAPVPTLIPTMIPEPTPQPTETPVPEGTPEPSPTPTATATPEPSPTPTATATPEPSRTPTVTPTPAATPAHSPVLMRELEYDYTIELPDDWSQYSDGRYSSSSTSAQLTISSQALPDGYSVDQFSQLVQDDLEKDWWTTASLFEVTSVEEGLTDNQPAMSIRYRVRESPEYCVLDVEELVVVSRILQGYPHGFRVRAWMCEHDVAIYGEARQAILDSFHVTTVPAEYYTQFIVANGVTVKAHGSVDPAAVEAGAEIVTALLSGREDFPRCMARSKGDLAVIPRDQTNVDLPEFAHLAGTKDFTGRRRDTYEIRGLGGVRGLPVSSAAEEQLLGNRGPEHPWYPYRGLVAAYEFAHGIQNLCFTPEDHER